MIQAALVLQRQLTPKLSCILQHALRRLQHRFDVEGVELLVVQLTLSQTDLSVEIGLRALERFLVEFLRNVQPRSGC